jgi:hypothetical protein
MLQRVHYNSDEAYGMRTLYTTHATSVLEQALIQAIPQLHNMCLERHWKLARLGGSTREGPCRYPPHTYQHHLTHAPLAPVVA